MFPAHKIFAHRGLHSLSVPANSLQAMTEALSLGFSIETDIRDRAGSVVVSHDPPKSSEKTVTLLSKILEIRRNELQTLALNVKSDGLLDILPLKPMGSHFFFDMSAPETVKFRTVGAPIAIRASEYESVSVSVSGTNASWVWLDSFEGDWFLDRDIGVHFLGKPTVVVSSELHGRKPEAAWKWVTSQHLKGNDVSICTDLPNQFLDFFDESPGGK
jgi:hypothetical protein